MSVCTLMSVPTEELDWPCKTWYKYLPTVDITFILFLFPASVMTGHMDFYTSTPLTVASYNLVRYNILEKYATLIKLIFLQNVKQ
jgi:hypothetical protein